MEEKKCRRPGCGKMYVEAENNGTACSFHPGKPIFHDCKKGWTCCGRTVYDWDEFQKIEGCAKGPHTDEKEAVEFFKSDTVKHAQTALDKEAVKIRTAADFNKEMEAKEKAKEAAGEKKEPKKNKAGRFVCGNMGCKSKTFLDEENSDTACQHHKGQPVFHDLKKYWTCCDDKECWDWDQFMELPTCAVGRHIYKYK